MMKQQENDKKEQKNCHAVAHTHRERERQTSRESERVSRTNTLAKYIPHFGANEIDDQNTQK